MTNIIHQARTIIPGMEEQHMRIEADANSGTVSLTVTDVDVDFGGKHGTQARAVIYLSAAQLQELAAAIAAAAAAVPPDASRNGDTTHLLDAQVNEAQAAVRAQRAAAVS